MRRIVSILILIAMTAHCASRLGLISYVYQNRHDIAYACGLTAEKVISLCSSNYFADGKLKLTDERSDDTLPSTLIQAQEINLFTPSEFVFSVRKGFSIKEELNSLYSSIPYRSPIPDIFHPPCNRS